MSLKLTRHDIFGNTRVAVGSFTFSNSYTTGGEACDPGIRNLEKVEIDQGVGGLMFQYDYANKKIKALHPTGGAAQAGLNDPSVAVPAGGTAVTSDAAQPNLVETAGVGKEVGSGADLSSITVKVVFYGQ